MKAFYVSSKQLMLKISTRFIFGWVDCLRRLQAGCMRSSVNSYSEFDYSRNAIYNNFLA